MRATRSQQKIVGKAILSNYPEERKRKRKPKELEPKIEVREYRETRSKSVESRKVKDHQLSRSLSSPALINNCLIKVTSKINIGISPQVEAKLRKQQEIATRIKNQAEYIARVNELKKETTNIINEIEELEDHIATHTSESSQSVESPVRSIEFPVTVYIETPGEPECVINLANSSQQTFELSEKPGSSVGQSSRKSKIIPNPAEENQKSIEQIETPVQILDRSSGNANSSAVEISVTTPEILNNSANISGAWSEQYYTPQGTLTPFNDSIKPFQSIRRKLFSVSRTERKENIDETITSSLKTNSTIFSRKPQSDCPHKKYTIITLRKKDRISKLAQGTMSLPDQNAIISEGSKTSDPLNNKNPRDNKIQREAVVENPREKAKIMVNHHQVVSLRDALAVVPEYDGRTSSLSAFIQGCEEAVEMLEPESEKYLVKAVRVKIKGEPRRTIHLHAFENIEELTDFLKSVYAPARNIYQLQGELGSIYQKPNESVIAYSNRLRDLGFQIFDAHEYGANPVADEAFKKNTVESLPTCFINGLKTEIE